MEKLRLAGTCLTTIQAFTTAQNLDSMRRAVERMNAEQLFNLPLAEYFLLLDTGDAAAYKSAHIATAWSLPDYASIDHILCRSFLHLYATYI